MYKYILLAILFLGNLTAFTQKKYLCEFSDTVTTLLPDSVFAQLLTSARPDIEIPPEVMQQYLSQVKQKLLSMVQKRVVKAEIEKTIISIERSSRTGILSMEAFDSLLYKNDELFPDSATASGFSVLPIALARKDFLATGNIKVIMNYKCKEYVSTDSTCRIWVTTELPDYLNPGIRIGNIKGAVLGFELKSTIIVTRSFLTGFGRSL